MQTDAGAIIINFMFVLSLQCLSDRSLGVQTPLLVDWIRENITGAKTPICVTELPEKFLEFLYICDEMEYKVSVIE